MSKSSRQAHTQLPKRLLLAWIFICVCSTLENTECKQWLKSKILIQCVNALFFLFTLALSSVQIRLLVQTVWNSIQPDESFLIGSKL